MRTFLAFALLFSVAGCDGGPVPSNSPLGGMLVVRDGGPATVEVGAEVAFGVSLSDEESDALEALLRFGDDSDLQPVSDGDVVTHVYDTTGTFDASLRVRDESSGFQDAGTVAVTVTEDAPEPAAREAEVAAAQKRRSARLRLRDRRSRHTHQRGRVSRSAARHSSLAFARRGVP